MKPASRPMTRFAAMSFYSALRSVLIHGLLIGMASIGATWSPAAQAQIRSFPEKTKIGMLQMGNFPEAQLDGKRIIFAPGVRIMNVNNTTVMPMSIQSPVRIRYRLDAQEQVDRAWILSAEEARAAAEK